MKKSYSQFSLLSNKLLYGTKEKKGFFDYLLPKYRYLQIEVPYYEFLRGEVFVEDMKDLFEEAPQNISLYHLIALLYFDFLEQVKKGAKYEQICPFLISSKKKFLERPMVQKRVLKQLTSNLFSFEQREEEIEVTSEEKRAEITLRIKESELYRGEVFLHDISPYMRGEELTVEDLLVILFMDFLQSIKEKGNSSQVMKAILLNYEDYF
ncbi:hypothetical protein [Peribacillus frigoritolerans]|uniref:hypothetical protein n=1 Tax=Peribacillus frigoritolerans TaxID=450367 RepID=UPI002ECB9ABC|nr:hypothetical protein [Peribacillus frigoritolerans]